MSFLYFGYGSNLLRQRLQLSNPSARFVAVAKLENHALYFNCIGRDPQVLRWRGGAATIREEPGQSVWGCVWMLGNEHKETLDRQESVYDAKEVTVRAADGRKYTCRTYQLPAKYFKVTGTSDRPSTMYMDVIIKGAIQNRLPETYVNFLKEVETNELRDDSLEIYKDTLRRLNEDL